MFHFRNPDRRSHVIDKTDLRVSEFALPGPVLAEPLAQLKKHPIPGFRPSRFYQYTCDLRENYGVDAVVHLGSRFGRPTNKIEIIDAGEKDLSEIAGIVVQLFDVDPWSLPLMRIDVTADVEGIPVPWFSQHAYVNRKRFSSQIRKSGTDEVEFVGMGTAQAQSIYVGKRPNMIRIYDKFAELRKQYHQLEIETKRFNSRMLGMDLTAEERYYGTRHLPSFQEFCKAHGFPYREGVILTRIERQIGGGRIPAELGTLGDLKRADEFDPFPGLRIVAKGPVLQLGSPPEGVSVRNWLASLGLRYLEDQYGSLQTVRSIILRHGCGNGKRILECLEQASASERPPVTLQEIRESYRNSTLRQIADANGHEVYLSPTYECAKQSA